MRITKNNYQNSRSVRLHIRSLVIIIVAFLVTLDAQGQDYQKTNKRHHRNYYRKQTTYMRTPAIC